MFFEPMFFSICVKIILFDLIFWDLGSYVRRVVVAVSNMCWAHGCNSPEFQNYFLIQMPSNPSCLGFERLERGIACGCVSKMSWAQVCACLEFQNYFCNFIMCPPASLGFVCVCVCERERERGSLGFWRRKILKKTLFDTFVIMEIIPHDITINNLTHHFQIYCPCLPFTEVQSPNYCLHLTNFFYKLISFIN